MAEISITTEEAKKSDLNDLLQKLSSSAKGLPSSEAKARIQQYGYNEIIEKKKSLIIKLG